MSKGYIGKIRAVQVSRNSYVYPLKLLVFWTSFGCLLDGYSWNNNQGSFNVTIAAVTEPATMLLLGSGLIGLAGYRRKKLFKK